MSGSLNEVNIIGNLARDVEVRTTQAGKKIVTMTVATSESWKGQDGERKDKSEFHRVCIFNEGLAGVAERFLKKGSKVFLRGSLTTRKWQDKDGNDRYSTEVTLTGFDAKLNLLDRKEQTDVKQAAAGDLLDDEIPFG